MRKRSWVAAGLSLSLLWVSGCQSLQNSLAQMKNGAFKKTEASSGTPLPANRAKSRGYLSQGEDFLPTVERQTPDIQEKPWRENSSPENGNQEWNGNEKDKNSEDPQVLEAQVQVEVEKVKKDYEKQIADLKGVLEQERKQTDQFQKKALQLELDLLKKSQEMDRMRMEVMSKEAKFNAQYPAFYEVSAGDSLWKIASLGNIYKNPYKWIEIFYANQEKVANPDLIYPGLVLKIPRYLEMVLGSVEQEKESPAPPKEMESPEASEESPPEPEAKQDAKPESSKALEDLDEEL